MKPNPLDAAMNKLDEYVEVYDSPIVHDPISNSFKTENQFKNEVEQQQKQVVDTLNNFEDLPNKLSLPANKSNTQPQRLAKQNKPNTNAAPKKAKLPFMSATRKYEIYKQSSSPEELKLFPDEIKKAKARKVLQQLKQIEQTPIKLNINTPDPGSLAPDSSLDFQKQRLDQMIKESEQEKAREKLINSTRGLASFAPGVFDND